MKERPILFEDAMVLAILAGAKTQTRRVVKARADKDMGPRCVMQPHEIAGEVNGGSYRNSPYGEPGDRLWVRETWGVADKWLHECETDPPRCIAYRAGLAARNFDPVYDVDTSSWAFEPHMKWRPSIHMPRWASRITLEITGVRVERLTDISEADAMAEGSPFYEEGMDAPSSDTSEEWSYRASFCRLWESINGPGSWDANPWVWCMSFRRVQP
jgi:hypothetical protein